MPSYPPASPTSAASARGFVNNTVDIGAFEVGARRVTSLVVTTPGDVVDPLDGLTSLREAVANAESLAGPQTITFDPTVFATAQTITLTEVSSSLATRPPPRSLARANLLSISSNASGVFAINTGVGSGSPG